MPVTFTHLSLHDPPPLIHSLSLLSLLLFLAASCLHSPYTLLCPPAACDAQEKLRQRWTGSRITWGFMGCPLCSTRMQHPHIAEEVESLVRKQS
jgi:hypothetical protein